MSRVNESRLVCKNHGPDIRIPGNFRPWVGNIVAKEPLGLRLALLCDVWQGKAGKGRVGDPRSQTRAGGQRGEGPATVSDKDEKTMGQGLQKQNTGEIGRA